MNKIYKYQLKPTKSQITAIKQQLKIHKALYNHCLAKRELAYQDYEINNKSSVIGLIFNERINLINKYLIKKVDLTEEEQNLEIDR